MGYLDQADWDACRPALADFFESETDKVCLVIGSEEPGLYGFMDASVSFAAANKAYLVFRYEVGKGEHPSHYLYRWLQETATGPAFAAPGGWSELERSQPRLAGRLSLLLEKDIRPLEIRFLEAVRFLSRIRDPWRRMIFHFVPRTGVAEDSFVNLLRTLVGLAPFHVKFLVGAMHEDAPARQTEFAPSNRLVLARGQGAAAESIGERYAALEEGKGLEGRILQILGRLEHPVPLPLLARLAGETASLVEQALHGDDLACLVEKYGQESFRLAYPRAHGAAQGGAPDGEALDRKAVQFLEQGLQDRRRPCLEAVYHSMDLLRIRDPSFFASHVLGAVRSKLEMGAGDLCEQELGRALELAPDHDRRLRARLLLSLGEVREKRMRNQEALAALEPAIGLLREEANGADLLRALELKGRAAFSIRDLDTAKASLEESLELARQTGRGDMIGDLLSQLGYLAYSSRNLEEAQRRYRLSLEAYQALSQQDGPEARKGEAAQWANLGHTCYGKGEFGEAEEHHRKALAIFDSLGDGIGSAAQWGHIGHCLFAAQDFAGAIEAYERAAAMEEARGELERAVQRLANVGHSLFVQGKHDLAVRSFEKALEKSHELGDPEGEATQLSNLGIAHGNMGDFEKAMAYLRQAAALYAEMGDPVGEAAQLLHMGHLRQAEGNHGEAEEHYRKALDAYRALQYPMGEAGTLADLGSMYLEKEDWEGAVQCHSQAVGIYERIGNRERQASCLVSLAQAHRGLGQPDRAFDNLHKAEGLLNGEDHRGANAAVRFQLGLLEHERNHHEEARRYYEDALAVFEEKQDADSQAAVLSNLGSLHYLTGRLALAGTSLNKALSLVRAMNNEPGVAAVLRNLGFVYETQGEYGQAYSCLREAAGLFGKCGMGEQAAAVEKQLNALEEKAAKSLERMRSQLFPGLSPPADGPAPAKEKVGRNQPCPCGSGKKYKRCCGA